jgi:hypothetical protein
VFSANEAAVQMYCIQERRDFDKHDGVA